MVFFKDYGKSRLILKVSKTCHVTFNMAILDVHRCKLHIRYSHMKETDITKIAFCHVHFYFSFRICSCKTIVCEYGDSVQKVDKLRGSQGEGEAGRDFYSPIRRMHYHNVTIVSVTMHDAVP